MKMLLLKLRRFLTDPFSHSINSKVFVFCHIPRTGGSSIWHDLAKFAGNGLNVYDLFYETGQRYGGNLNCTRTVLHEDCIKLSIPMNYRLVVHHHIHIRVGDLFQVRRPVYFTYIRDPLSRFVSELRWNAQLFKEGELFFYQDYNRAKWIPYLSGEKPLTDLLHNEALIKPYLSFYLNWFGGLMHRDTNDIPWKAEFNQSEKAAILNFVRANFALIGFEHGSQSSEEAPTTIIPDSTGVIPERMRFYELLATLLDLQVNQLDSGLHYQGTMSRKIDSIPGLTDPAFLDAVKMGMRDDYWFVHELQKMRLKEA